MKAQTLRRMFGHNPDLEAAWLGHRQIWQFQTWVSCPPPSLCCSLSFNALKFM